MKKESRIADRESWHDAAKVLLIREMPASLPIAIDQEKIMRFCGERGIRKMSLFGSVVRNDFDPARSDVDVLVEFFPDRIPAWEFFRWNEELGSIMGKKVDLHSCVGRHLRPYVQEDLLTIYEQA